MQKVSLDNGDVYHGHLNDMGQPHGFGRSVSPADGSSYEGIWKNGRRHGFGKSVSPDGSSYEGIWENGRRQKGKGVSALGPWFDGEWGVDDNPAGKGKGMSSLGHYFEGHIEQGDLQRGNVLMRVECVVADCPAAVAPLQMHQRVIPRELATMLGRPAGNCDLFHATFRTQNYEGSGMIEGTGTLADEANDGPILNGAFREVGNALDIVDMDMPHLVSMTPEERRSLQLQRLAYRRSLNASACDAQAREGQPPPGGGPQQQPLQPQPAPQQGAMPQGNAANLRAGDIAQFDAYVARMAQDPQNFPDIFDYNNAPQVAQIIEAIAQAQHVAAGNPRPNPQAVAAFIQGILQHIPDYNDYVQQQLAQQRIAKGQRKLDKFRQSKKKGGHRKYRRMRNITRRRHCK